MGKLNKGLTYQNIYQPHGAIEGRLIELRPWHRAMARAVVSGTRPTDLSILFNMTPTQISNITGSPAFLEYLASLERGAEMAATELRQDILNMAQRALEVIDEDLDLSPTPQPTRGKGRLDRRLRLRFSTALFQKTIRSGKLLTINTTSARSMLTK